MLARDEALVRWQYRNPHDPNSLSILRADDDQRLAGLLGVIHVDFNILGRRVPALWLAMWFATQTAPKVTGLALLRAAMEADIKVVACLGFNDNAERIYRGLRFSVVDEVPRWICITNAEAFRGLMHQAGPSDESALQTLTDAALIGRRMNPTHPCDSYRGAKRSPRNGTVNGRPNCPRARQEHGVISITCWRYVNTPSFKYHVHFAENISDGSLLGPGRVPLRAPVEPSGFQVIRIVELLGNDVTWRLLRQP